MTFQAPLFLLGLAALPLPALLYVRSERAGRRGRAAYVAPGLLPALTPRRPGWRRHGPVVAYALALAALIVAVARPQAIRAVPVEQATVVIVTDRSGSMLAKDVAPSRLVAARNAAETFVDAVPDDVRIGAIAFNHEPSVLQSPTRDHAAVTTALGSVTAAGSTATGDALDSALALIRTSKVPGQTAKAPAAIVLLSDGQSVRGKDALAVADKAAKAAKAKVPVYTVALGTASGTIPGTTPSGTAVTRQVPPDPATLAQIAKRTGGETFAIKDAGELELVYEKLGSQLATEERQQQVTGLVAGSALLLLLAGMGTSLRWFGRLV
jgi:Ca-activated chloride channel family protein